MGFRTLYSTWSLYGAIDERLQAKVDVDYERGTLVVQQPRRYGGRRELTLHEYEALDGDMGTFIQAIRSGSWSPLKYPVGTE